METESKSGFKGEQKTKIELRLSQIDPKWFQGDLGQDRTEQTIGDYR